MFSHCGFRYHSELFCLLADETRRGTFRPLDLFMFPACGMTTVAFCLSPWSCPEQDMEVATVALACVYFERLCLAGVVTKPNRRLTMAACLVIAYKFNEPVLVEGVSKLPALWSFIDQEWLVRAGHGMQCNGMGWNRIE